MTIVNYFPQFDRSDLCHIFRQAGAFSNLAQVSFLFNEVVKEEADKFYTALTGLFGKFSMAHVIKALGVDTKSDGAKIDALFFNALRSQKGEGNPLICYNQNTLKDVMLYMCPFLLAEGVAKLWVAVANSGNLGLKVQMGAVKFGDDLLENAVIARKFFRDHPSALAKVETLNFNKKELQVLPPEIFHFSKLKKLDLSNNAMAVLPSEIGLLKELTDLRLSYNSLESLPEEIGQLHALENFQCAFNRLRAVPDSLCNLRKLRSLNLSGNQIKALPEKIDGLQALNYLYLESNALSCLPSSIGSIPYLIGLYLFNNQISELPDSLCDMMHLKYLSAQNNALTALPENVGGLVSLTTLLLDGNPIQELPASVCALKNLSTLFLSCDQIEVFPEGMGALQKLELFYSGKVHGVLNPSLTKEQFDRIYWGLGERKWKECIDGCHHVHGPDVYDKGLHGKSVEPGFLPSMFQSFQFLSAHPNQMIDADFYLQLHKEACGHFKGKDNCTLMGQEKVGVFRDSGDRLSAGFPEDRYFMTDSAVNEFNELNMQLGLKLGASFRIGDIVNIINTKSKVIHYFPLSQAHVKSIFNLFVTEFYYDIGHAKGDFEQVGAIAKLIQRLEWLHSVRDGCGRTDTALLNYLLTSYGFNPVLLEFPYVSSCKGLDQWTSIVMKGTRKWREEAGL